MDKYQRQTLQGIFTAATIMAEQAGSIAIKGQSLRLKPVRAQVLARELRRHAAELAALAEAAGIIAREGQ